MTKMQIRDPLGELGTKDKNYFHKTNSYPIQIGHSHEVMTKLGGGRKKSSQ